MRARVVGVSRSEDGAASVVFECSAGNAKAIWASKVYQPEVGGEYDVELDVSVTADRHTNVKDARQQELGLSIESGAVVLVAMVDAVDDDGLAYLRLSDDCLIMIDTSGAFTPGEVIKISVPAPSVLITATGSA